MAISPTKSRDKRSTIEHSLTLFGLAYIYYMDDDVHSWAATNPRAWIPPIKNQQCLMSHQLFFLLGDLLNRWKKFMVLLW